MSAGPHSAQVLRRVLCLLQFLVRVCVLSHFSRVQLFQTLWTVAHQAPLSRGFCRQEYWSGLLCPPPGGFPDPGIKPAFPKSPALAGGFFTTGATVVVAGNPWGSLVGTAQLHFLLPSIHGFLHSTCLSESKFPSYWDTSH